jgi:hypothetical protein
VEVVHVLGRERTERHRMHPAARLESGRVRYPPAQGSIEGL